MATENNVADGELEDPNFTSSPRFAPDGALGGACREAAASRSPAWDETLRSPVLRFCCCLSRLVLVAFVVVLVWFWLGLIWFEFILSKGVEFSVQSKLELAIDWGKLKKKNK